MIRYARILLAIIGFSAAAYVVLQVILLGYDDDRSWTGFGDSTITKETTHNIGMQNETVDVAEDVQRSRTLWDWLNLLIVPLTLAGVGTIGGYLLKQADDKRANAIAEQSEQNDALQSYFDQMSQLVLTSENEKLHRVEMDDNVRSLLQARTQPLLDRLAVSRKRSIVRFWSFDADLFNKDKPILNLTGLDLSGIDLSGVNFKNAKFDEAKLECANFRRAILRHAKLTGANLEKADLSEADLYGAKLEGTHLVMANLDNSKLQQARFQDAVLKKATLAGARLQGARFHGANLKKAVFENANLQGATLTRLRSVKQTDFRNADLTGTDLRFSDLRKARNLTQEQIDAARGNQETHLPKHLRKPEGWTNDN